MTGEIIKLAPDETVRDAVQKFADHKISGSPVLDTEGNLLGIVSETDILNAVKTKCKRLEMVYPSLSLVSVSFIEGFDKKEVEEAFQEISATPVAEIMTKDPITVNLEGELGEAIDIMNKSGINRIPVTSNNDVVGIITRRDIIKGLAKEG